MRRSRFAPVAFVVACQQSHEVTIQLGPTDDSLSAGFTCVSDDEPMRLLVRRALQPDGTLRFAFVVDFIGLGGTFPGCRGEELLAACRDSGCEVLERADGTRYCRDITVDAPAVDAALSGNLEPILETVRAQLRMEPVAIDAPDQPVIIRAVATAETVCGMVPEIFDKRQLLGCAYSCPVQLDEIDGPIALSLDTLNRECEKAVIACATALR